MLFGNPHVLWLLLLVPPALLAFFWWSWRKRKSLLARFIQTRLLAALTVGISPARQKIRLGALLLAVVCLILALARPQWGFMWEEVKQRGLDIVVAIDTSKSMLAEDIAPNRLARAKLAALDLMKLARSDRLGLVAFAGTAFLQCPLTIDDVAFRQSVESLSVNTLPEGGTAIAEAIEAAQGAFKEDDNYRVLVLFSDGEDHDTRAVEAAKKAAESGLKIYTIGIGTADGELLRIKDAKGGSDYIRNENGEVVKSKLNEQLLREISGATEGGFYLPMRGAKVIDSLYEQGLAKLPKSEHQEKLVKHYYDRYHWFLGAAILLLIAEMLFPERGRQGGNASSRPHAAAAGAAIGTLIALLLVFPGSAFGSASGAMRDYKQGKYDKALNEYQTLLKKKESDSRLNFNAGAAAYQHGDYAAAAKYFEKAMDPQDLKLQAMALYNRGNAQYFIGDKLPDPEKKMDAWKKSLNDFQSAMKLEPNDSDARHNHEFVKKRLEELQQQQQKSKDNSKPPEPSEEAKKARAAADEAVRQRQYARALEIMEQQLAKDPTTAAYSDFIEKLKEVTGVQNSVKP